MTDANYDLLKKRCAELGARSWSRGQYNYTDFLSLAEQDAVLSMRPAPDAFAGLWGGWKMAERKLAVFGSEDVCGYADTPPITCVRISPLSPKFAENLTHRDFLGSLMGLGIKREVLGDIIVENDHALLFCLDAIAPFITENLTQVRRTSVRAEICAVPEITLRDPEPTEFNVASERLDAIVAAVYNLPRSKSADLFAEGMVFVNGRMITSPGHTLQPDAIVSVRHMGRFVYCGIVKETRKGRLRVTVKVY